MNRIYLIKNIIVNIPETKWLSGVMLLLCIMSLYGCVSSPSGQQLERAKINDNLLKDAERASNVAREESLRFLDCAKGYAMKNAQASVTATELSEAAVSECELHLMLYESNRVNYHSSLGNLTSQSLDDIARTEEKAKYKAKIDRQELTVSGKGLVINTLIDMKK